MKWRLLRPLSSSYCSSLPQTTLARRIYPSLQYNGRDNHETKAFSSLARHFHELDCQQVSIERVHDVASALRAATQEPVPTTVTAIVRTIRRQKRHSFVKLGDGSTTEELQVLLNPAESEGLATGAMIKVSGMLRPCPPGMQQSHELHASSVNILGFSDAETYPIQKKHQTTEFLRTLPHLRLRTAWNGLLTRLRSEVDFSSSEWFRDNGFVRAHTPVITSSDCEGAGEVFTVAPASDQTISDTVNATEQHFFRSPKFLTVSSQLHLEAYVHAHRAVWALGPTFRAEKSVTPRHLSEFYMLEAEIQTASLPEVMDVVENLLRHIARRLQASPLGKELLSYDTHTEENSTTAESETRITGSNLESRWSGLLAPFPRISYTEAISHLKTAHAAKPNIFHDAPEWGNSLALQHEKYLANTLGHGQTPVFITDYPSSIKPFYMLPSGETPKGQTCSNFDLLLPDMAEVAGGSLRTHSAADLTAAMRARGLSQATPDPSQDNPEPSQGSLAWYVALREHGSVPHGGFGLGFDRLLCYLSGERNVREVVAWPRWIGRCDG